MIGLKDVCVFFNTRIENAGTLSQIGDLGLAPLRYLCGGKTVQLFIEGREVTIHSVASFHKEGKGHVSISEYTLRSSPTHMLKALGSVLLIVPGLFLAVAKLVAYMASGEVRKNHGLISEHLTPINREIGTFDQPMMNHEELRTALQNVWDNDPMHRPTNALIIHGENLQINVDPGILRFNPMKLILQGASIVHQPAYFGRLDDNLLSTHKWETVTTMGWRVVTPANPNAPGITMTQENTIGEALNAPLRRRGWLTWKCFHRVFVVPRPGQEVRA
jgi:hypothetical protein